MSETAGAVRPEQLAQLPDGAVIFFRQEGGFAGIMKEWTIYADGRIVTETGSEWTIPVENVAQLLDAVEQTGFFQTPPPKIVSICCDFFDYTLVARKDTLANAVVVSDGDPNLPTTFREAISAVQQVVNQSPGQ